MRIAVVDYCKGNLRSVQKGLEAVGGEAFITMNPREVEGADAVVLPGVGAFADAAHTMVEIGLMEAVRESIVSGKPFLGICLGMHLLFEAGEEGGVGDDLPAGLGIFPGICRHLPARAEDGTLVKIPHVGWNTVDYSEPLESAISQGESTLFDGIEPSSHFYFTHSYACVPDDDACVLATTSHGRPFASVVGADNVYGVQFHPEKSSVIGLKMLDNFVNRICRA